MRLAPRSGTRQVGELLAAAMGLCISCGGDPELSQPATFSADQQALSCSAGCGGQLGTAVLPGPSGSVTLTAWSNSPQLGTIYDCDPTPCAGPSPVRAQNGQLSYGCPWQCVELVNRYFQGTWGDPKIAADAGASFCLRAASSTLPQYWVYGQYGASTSGHAPVAGDVLVWSSHVAIATNSMSPGAAGTISVIAQNATCSGADTVAWDGSMFGPKYGLSALCWVHVMANTGATGPMCPTGSNWHYAGDYCWDAPGMQHTAPNTLYSCNAAGGAASVVQVCSAGCQQMPAGQNDQCTSLLPNGSSCTANQKCQSGQCVSGVCCNSACGACGSCATGTCVPFAAHSQGQPACNGGLLCSGNSASCLSACTTSADCVAGDSCVGSACVPQTADGGSATPDGGSAIADGGTAIADAGTAIDAGNEIGTGSGLDAGTQTGTGDGSHPESSAVGKGCASGGGSAWSAGAALVFWLVRSRRRVR